MSVDLSTRYLGLTLAHPLVPGASPLCDDLDMVRRLEDAGAPALVMRSLFEEQIAAEHGRTAHDLAANTDTFAEAASFFPQSHEFRLAPDAYLRQVQRLKAAVKIPVIASLNGVTASGWLDYARLIEQAGADALELNCYHVASDPTETAWAVEQRTLSMVEAVKCAVAIPVAAKLSPYFSSLSHFASEIETAGADGLVLFNRFYQPDIDAEALEVKPELHLSDSSELLLRLRWLAILSGQRKLDLCVSGGVHEPGDVVKAIMAGASAVQLVSALLQYGPTYLTTLRVGLDEWMEEHDYGSIDDMRGCMNLARCPDPSAFERGNYMRVLQTWRPRWEV